MVTTPSELELVVDPVMLVSMLCTCKILDVMLVLTTLILVWATDNTLIWVVVKEIETMFVCDIRDDRYLKSIFSNRKYISFLQRYVIMVSEPMSSTSLARLSTLRVSQATQLRKKELLVMALVSLELKVKEV